MGASLSDIYVYPLVRKSQLSNEPFVTSYGYVCSTQPCEAGCIIHLAESLYRPANWNVSCQYCGNYITFADLSRYVACVGQRGKRLSDIHAFMEVYFTYKGKEGTNDGEIPAKDKIRLDGE